MSHHVGRVRVLLAALGAVAGGGLATTADEPEAPPTNYISEVVDALRDAYEKDYVEGHSVAIRGLAISADGKTLISGVSDKT